jgi:mycothione reductase
VSHYDLVIVGAGSGNTIIDERFDGWRIAVVEPGPFGGTCLNRGCIPSKMLIHPAEVALAAAEAGPRLGVRTSYAGVDWPALRDRVFDRTDGVAADGRGHRERSANVDVLTGTCAFTGERELLVVLADGTSRTITAEQVVLAAGSRPVVPDVPGLDGVHHHTSDDVMRLDRLPASLGVVGGGYVGSELAHLFATLGSRVVQVEAADALLTGHDASVSRLFTEEVSQRWDVRLGTSLERVAPAATGDGVVLHLDDGSTAEVEVLLLAIGRRPNSDRLGLEHAGVAVHDDGRVVVDEHQRTSADGVWALGDLSSPEPLKHVANQDARVVQHNLLHPERLRTSDHRFVPSAVFAHPQVAAVGLTEPAATEQGLDLAVVCRSYDSTAHGWAMLEDDTGHFVKLLADRATGRLVGAHLVGPQASVLVQPLVQAMSFDQPVRGLARGQYWIHPALTEVVENALIELEAELGPEA